MEDSWYTLALVYSENYLVNEALFALEKALTLNSDLISQARSEQSFYSLMDSKLFQFLISKKEI
ncbi:MAG: TPR end-of-group domain-containing protein [Candidatus Heimdallarchaeota archaeon]